MRGAAAALLTVAAAWPAAAQDRPACEALLAAIDAGRIHQQNDPAGAAHVATVSGSDEDCAEWLAKADPPAAVPMFESALPEGLCEQLVAVALAEVLVPDWQAEYDEIVDTVAAGDEAECLGFFEEYGREVLGGRGPVCTRLELLADAGMTQSYADVIDAALGGDEALCQTVLDSQRDPPAAPADPEAEETVYRGTCETIIAGVEARAFRYGWQEEADELLDLAVQGDQDECWEVLEEYASETPDRRQGPWCSRAELAAASGFTRAPEILAEAADSGSEQLCREAVEAHPAAN